MVRKTNTKSVVINNPIKNDYINNSDLKKFLDEFLTASRGSLMTPPSFTHKALIVGKSIPQVGNNKLHKTMVLPDVINAKKKKKKIETSIKKNKKSKEKE